jgi:hypothetical protein
VCRDLATDRLNCGMCGNACAPGEVCSMGTCVTTCPAGSTLCGGRCVDTSSDAANCGACGMVCPAGTTCSGGACSTTCGPGLTNCGGMCTNTSFDPAHCGGCGMACRLPNATPGCAGGSCFLAACDAGFGDCDRIADNGCETDLQTSVTHCGACGRACVLPNATAGCRGGSCVVASCNSGFGDCDGAPVNGCEANLSNDAANCGRCGNACRPGETCASGSCGFGTGRAGDLLVFRSLTINTTRASVSGSAGSRTVTISNATDTFAPGDLVLLHQSQRAVGSVGHYEYRRVTAVAGGTLTLDAPLTNDYVTDATSHAQMVFVHEYRDVLIVPGATLTAPAWDGNHGGILVFEATGTVTVDGLIDMSARGFRGRVHACIYRCGRGYQGEGHLDLGGVHIAANGSGGGGGGAGQDGAAGGGGGYGTAGAAGGPGFVCGSCREACPIPGGAGGSAAGSDDLGSVLLFGGAGGEGGADEDGGNPGRGGNGGGIVLIRASGFSVLGGIRSDGEVGAGGCTGCCGGVGCGMGGGGGGAGGAIRLVALGTADLGSGLVRALGGGGGASTCNGGPGGSGGVGRIGVRAATTIGTTSPTFDPR